MPSKKQAQKEDWIDQLEKEYEQYLKENNLDTSM